MMPRIAQIFWVFFFKQYPTDKLRIIALFFEYFQI